MLISGRPSNLIVQAVIHHIPDVFEESKFPNQAIPHVPPTKIDLTDGRPGIHGISRIEKNTFRFSEGVDMNDHFPTFSCERS
jgi:hypothetical protein